MKTAREIGFEKEKEVCTYLKNLGLKILETNFRTCFGEIDIIAQESNAIVFIEVKYRKSSYSGTPQEAVSLKKQEKIIKSAVFYIQKNNLTKNIRFDVAAVSEGKIEIIKSAFIPKENIFCF
jgi:putative endonuclease